MPSSRLGRKIVSVVGSGDSELMSESEKRMLQRQDENKGNHEQMAFGVLCWLQLVESAISGATNARPS
jgi:hypothetical protein